MSHALVIAELDKRGEHDLVTAYVRIAGIVDIIRPILEQGGRSAKRILFPSLATWLAAMKLRGVLTKPLIKEIINVVLDTNEDGSFKKLNVTLAPSAKLIMSMLLAILAVALFKKGVPLAFCKILPKDEFCRLVHSNKTLSKMSRRQRFKFMFHYYSGKSEAVLQQKLDQHTKAIKQIGVE